MPTPGERIKERRLAAGYTLLDAANYIGVREATMQRYESGKIKTLKHENLVELAKLFGCSPSYLMGWTDDPSTDAESANVIAFPTDIPRGYEPIVPTRRVPLRGDIACGVPILAIEDVSEYVNLPQGVAADFALRCKGDSMIGARILDGDIVYIRAQPDVENGEIAAVEVDGEATLKRVYKMYMDGRVHVMELRAENPNMQPIILTGDKLSSVRIDGKAVWFASLVR